MLLCDPTARFALRYRLVIEAQSSLRVITSKSSTPQTRRARGRYRALPLGYAPTTEGGLTTRDWHLLTSRVAAGSACFGHFSSVSARATRDYIVSTPCLLYGRTCHIAKRAKHAAIACFRLEQRSASGAFIEELAGVSWHGLSRLVAALGTGDRGNGGNGTHCEITMPVLPGIRHSRRQPQRAPQM